MKLLILEVQITYTPVTASSYTWIWIYKTSNSELESKHISRTLPIPP